MCKYKTQLPKYILDLLKIMEMLNEFSESFRNVIFKVLLRGEVYGLKFQKLLNGGKHTACVSLS